MLSKLFCFEVKQIRENIIYNSFAAIFSTFCDYVLSLTNSLSECLNFKLTLYFKYFLSSLLWLDKQKILPSNIAIVLYCVIN